MNITLQTEQASVPVAVLTTHGDIDASNYMELVDTAQEVYQTGVTDVLLDLSDTPFLSSAGLVALYSVSRLLSGEPPIDRESGWSAIHEMENHMADEAPQHLKLLNPQQRVIRTLERSGMLEYFPMFTDLQEALASFQPKTA